MSITPAPLPGPDSETPPRSRRGVLWKWSLAVTAVVLSILMWQCGTGLLKGRSLSAAAVQRFHEQLNRGQYEEIWDEGDEAFHTTGKRELSEFLAAVHRKLGNAGLASLNNLHVSATTNGTFIVAVYNTQFERGPAVETFTWTKRGDEVKLYGYNVQSNLLVLN